MQVLSTYLGPGETLAVPVRCIVLPNATDAQRSLQVSSLTNDTTYVVRLITEDDTRCVPLHFGPV